MQVKIVGYCPKCKSPRTGYFCGSVPDRIKVLDKFIHGERVFFYEFGDNRKLNCFCEECGHRWAQKLKRTYLTHEKFNEYLHQYEFYEERNELREYIEKEKANMADTEIEKKAKKYKIISTIAAFTLGIDVRKKNPYTKK